MKKTKFEYRFEKKGEMAPKSKEPNHIWIDVGNSLDDGIFDHHQNQNSQYCSAFECVVRETDNYKSLQAYLHETENPEVEFHVHEEPDVDCIFSVYVIQRMIDEQAANPAAVFSEDVLQILLNYVNDIDAGRKKRLSAITLYAYICRIGRKIDDAKKPDGTGNTDNSEQQKKKSKEELEREKRERNLLIMTEGLRLLGLVVKELEAREQLKEQPVDLFNTPLKDYIDVGELNYYESMLQNLQKWNKEYQEEKKDGAVEIRKVGIWNKVRQSLEEVDAAIWTKLPVGEDEYAFARDEDNCLMTVYPREIRYENEEKGTTSVIIALNPDRPEAEQYSLRPIAEVIEQCEQIEEELYREYTGRYRRDHSSCRKDRNNPDPNDRFSRTPFYATSDPWFIAPKEDLIDAPRAGSLLPYERILSLIQDSSFMTKRVSFLQYTGRGEQIESGKAEEFGTIGFGQLYARTKEKIDGLKFQKSNETQYLFAYVKVAPPMIKFSNNWLKACCLYMVGQEDSGASRGNIFFIDYRTCLYTDQTVTILVAVDEQNQRLSSLVNEENLKASPLCCDLEKLLGHRDKLNEIGNNLSKMSKEMFEDDSKIEEYNKDLVKLNTSMAQEKVDKNSLEQDVYAFLNRALGIESLKDNVITSAKLLIENAEQENERKESERDSYIQAGIGAVSVFAIFSAFTDSFDFIAKFVPGSEGSEWSELMNYRTAFFAVVIFWVGVFVLGGIAVISTMKSLKVKEWINLKVKWWIKTADRIKKKMDRCQKD